MGHNEQNIFVGKDVGGNEIYAGFRFQVDVPQGTQLTLAELTLWAARLYPAAQAVFDTFTDENGKELTLHFPDMGDVYAWQRLGSYEAEVSSNVVRPLTEDYDHRVVYGMDTGEADGTVIAVCDHGAYALRASGMMFRGADASNYWCLWNTADSDYDYPYQTVFLHKRVNGSWTEIGHYKNGYITHTNTFKVVLDGNSIKCYVDGVLKFDVTDSDLADNTMHGLFFKSYAVNGRGWVNDFEFIPVGTPSPNIEVACHDVDNAPDFNAGDLPGDRVLTTAKVSLGDISGWTEGDWNTTVDIKDAIQEILDRPGWSANNYLAIILKPTDACGNGELLRIDSYEKRSDPSTELFLTW